MWRMLPKDFRKSNRVIYGKGEPIIINNEAFLLAFGFKKWTITSIWDKPADQKNKDRNHVCNYGRRYFRGAKSTYSEGWSFGQIVK